MERNKIKIICNPYEKTILYKRWSIGEANNEYCWNDLGNKSQLVIDEKFKHATIQHNAYEIIKTISDEYNRGNVGLDIIFEGTKEDYQDLKEVVDCFFSETDINCISGEKYIESAIEVMPKINESFGKLSKLFTEYDSDIIMEFINQYIDATKPLIPICIVGMYSTGKSAFINSLIGAEVLPSAITPTTARNYKIIKSEKNGVISFLIAGEKISIFFENDQYKITGNIDTELRKKINDELESLEENGLTNNMYYALRVINTYADETNRISELIEVEVPFYNGELNSDDYSFVIFDTPGSDTESHGEHLKVLKKALSEQTNGLPILITTPNEMDKKSAKELIMSLNEIDGNLDLTNAMVIVNRADETNMDELNKLKQGAASTILSEWKSNRLYFLSSIIGLGGKKDNYDNEWIDKNYFETFCKNKVSFTSEKNMFYKQLYKQNKVAENRLTKYISDVQEIKEERQLLYINSGLHFIEKEIIEFAQKYALYNKCSQAQEYLNQAINYTKKEIDESEKEQENEQKTVFQSQDDKKKELLNNLRERAEELKDKYVADYPHSMSTFLSIEEPKYREKIENFINKNWVSVKEQKEQKNKVNEFLRVSNNDFENIANDIKKQVSEYSKIYWNKGKDQLQDECCKIINGNESASDEEKKYLSKFVLNLNFPLFTEVNNSVSAEDIQKHFLFIGLDKINPQKAYKQYKECLDDYLSIITSEIHDKHIKEFDRWCKSLENGLNIEIASFNPKLKDYRKKLQDIDADIKKFKEQQNCIIKEKMKIQKMFELKTKEES